MSVEPAPSGVQLAPGVSSGAGCDLQPPCIVGKAPRGAAPASASSCIGRDATIRPFTTIYAGSAIGDRLQTGQGASIREDNVLGDDVSIGTNAVLEFGNRIGNRVRIHSGCFLEMVTIEDDVFVGPNVVFTDDPHPMGCPRYTECKGGAIVRRLARIGANSTILPGVVIGENCPGRRRLRGGPRRPGRRRSSSATPPESSGASTSSCASPGFYERPYVWPPYSGSA